MKTQPVKGKTGNIAGREKKLADSPRMSDESERSGPEILEARGFPSDGKNKNLHHDPRHANEARQQVKGGSEVGFKDAGIREGESSHPKSPDMTHYGNDTEEIGVHQAAIIDKHARVSHPFSHSSRSKESYGLAPESRSITKGHKGANGPSGNPQARKN